MNKQVAQRLHSAVPKRILALDGGGTRGIVTLCFLAEMERVLRTKFTKPDLVLADYFDLIGGTSVGAMIGTLLALGRDVAYVREKFERWAPRIFEPTAWGWLSPIFDARRIRGLVQAEVRDWQMKSDQLKTGLCIVAKRIDTGSVWPITNNPSDPYYLGRPPQGNKPARLGNGDYKLLDLIRASTAAPRYFSPNRIRIFEGVDDFGNPNEGLFVDGGVSPHNSPALQLFMMAGISGYNLGGGALAPRSARRPWPLGADRLLIVSVGTGTYDYKVEKTGAAVIDAVNALQSMVGDGQELGLTLLQWMSDNGPEPAWHIDRVLGDLSDDLLGRGMGFNKPLLSFRRYDVRLEHDWLAEHVGQTVSEERLAALRDFTNTTELAMHARIGEAAAKLQVRTEHFPDVFDAIGNNTGAAA